MKCLERAAKTCADCFWRSEQELAAANRPIPRTQVLRVTILLRNVNVTESNWFIAKKHPARLSRMPARSPQITDPSSGGE